jgi:uncharacterized membrane protein YGL010W
MAMCSVAFLLATLVAKASVATLLGFMVFIIGWIMQTVSSPPTHQTTFPAFAWYAAHAPLPQANI